MEGWADCRIKFNVDNKLKWRKEAFLWPSILHRCSDKTKELGFSVEGPFRKNNRAKQHEIADPSSMRVSHMNFVTGLAHH